MSPISVFRWNVQWIYQGWNVWGFFKFQKASLLHAYSSIEIPQVCGKIKNTAVLPLAVERESGPNLVDKDDSPSCELLQSAWGGKQHLISKTRMIPLVFPLLLLLGTLPTSAPCHFFSQLEELTDQIRGWDCCYGFVQCLAALVIYRSNLLPFLFHFKAHVLLEAFSGLGWGSLVIFIMQLYSSQKCFLLFHASLYACKRREILCLHYKKKIEAQ